MSGVSSSGATGTNNAPVSFPGIASGIDYNSIIAKYTTLTLAPTKTLQTQVTALNAANAELLKIQALFGKVQDSMSALSNPALFNAVSATSSNLSFATAAQTSGATATPGSYTILSSSLATATQIASNPAAGAPSNHTAVLNAAGTSITPNNGGSTPGKITIDGITTTYDVTTQSLNTIVANLNAASAGKYTVAFGTGAQADQVIITNTAGNLSIGSAADLGNLADVLHLTNANITTSAQSTANIGGLNDYATLNTGGNAGYATAVTAGTFTVNGVSLSVDPTTESLSNILSKITQSAAGVNATYDPSTASVQLTNKVTGAQSIVISDGSSNFLTASGLISGTTSVGQQSQVKYLAPDGTTKIQYSNSNAVTNVIPGVTLNLISPATSPFTVNIALDSSQAATAIGTFVTSYNAAITEINNATVAPVISTGTNVQTGQAQAQQLTTGGVLYKYDNFDVINLKNQLIDTATSLVNTGSSSYNSLSSIGLLLSSTNTSQTVTPPATGSSAAPTVSTKIGDGTDGTFAALDTAKFAAALAANPLAVQHIFTGVAQPTSNPFAGTFLPDANISSNSYLAGGSIVSLLGNFLTSVTGIPTTLFAGLAGTIPSISLFGNLENTNNSSVDSLNKQIQQITDAANAQADSLRKEFTASESQIAGLQAVQQSLGSLTSSFGGR